jgi:uncharacterized protein YukE
MTVQLTPSIARSAADTIEGGIGQLEAAYKRVAMSVAELAGSGMKGVSGDASAAKAGEINARIDAHSKLARDKAAGLRAFANALEQQEQQGAAGVSGINA